MNFSEIESEFIERVHGMVWCNVATIDAQGRPRSRILHPYWTGSTGWIGTRLNSFKQKHIAANPHVSLAYVAEITKPVYVDAVAEWADDMAIRQEVWDFFAKTPPPLGYDPGTIFSSVEDFGVLKIIPWRIEIYNFPPGKPKVWRA